MGTLPLDILIVGKTGTGKSSIGNLILGKNIFHTSPSSTSVTRVATYNHAVFEDRSITVVDTPGIFDTNDVQNVMSLPTHIMTLKPDGFHAILIALKFGGRYTKEEETVISNLKLIFGDSFITKYAIIVVTGGDLYDQAETEELAFIDWCRTQQGPFKQLFNECRQRVVLIDNKTKDKEKKVAQLKDLIQLVETISKTFRPYSYAQFLAASSDDDITNMKLAAFKNSIQQKITITEKISFIEDQIQPLENLHKNVNNLIKEIKECDSQSHNQKKLIYELTEISQMIGRKKRSILSIGIEFEKERTKRVTMSMKQNMEFLDEVTQRLKNMSEKQTNEKLKMEKYLYNNVSSCRVL